MTLLFSLLVLVPVGKNLLFVVLIIFALVILIVPSCDSYNILDYCSQRSRSYLARSSSLIDRQGGTVTTTMTKKRIHPSSTMAMTNSADTENDTNSDDNDLLELCAIQPPLRPDDQTPLEATQIAIRLMKDATAAATKKHIDLFVLPELSPIGYSEDTFARYLPKTKEIQTTVYYAIDELLANAAKSLDAHICYGTIGWYYNDENNNNNSDDNLKFSIRQVVVNPTGKIMAQYDKQFLCDYGDCNETRFFSTPSSMFRHEFFNYYHPNKDNRKDTTANNDKLSVTFSIKSFQIGMIICADMRSPELCRYLCAKYQIDILLQPAAFARDISFSSWPSFCETRSIENAIYFVGVNYSGDYFGQSSIYPPGFQEEENYNDEKDKKEKDNDTTLPKVLGTASTHLVATLSKKHVQYVRTKFPFYRNFKLLNK